MITSAAMFGRSLLQPKYRWIFVAVIAAAFLGFWISNTVLDRNYFAGIVLNSFK